MSGSIEFREEEEGKSGFLLRNRSRNPCAGLTKAHIFSDPPSFLSWILTHLARLSLDVTCWLHHVTRRGCRVIHEVVTNWLSCNPLCIFRFPALARKREQKRDHVSRAPNGSSYVFDLYDSSARTALELAVAMKSARSYPLPPIPPKNIKKGRLQVKC